MLTTEPKFAAALKLLQECLTIMRGAPNDPANPDEDFGLGDDEMFYDQETLTARTELIKTCFDITDSIQDGLIDYTEVTEIPEPEVVTLDHEHYAMMRTLWSMVPNRASGNIADVTEAVANYCRWNTEIVGRYPDSKLHAMSLFPYLKDFGCVAPWPKDAKEIHCGGKLLVLKFEAEVEQEVHTLNLEQKRMYDLVRDMCAKTPDPCLGKTIVEAYAAKYPEAGLAGGYDPCYIAEMLLSELSELNCIDMILPVEEDFTVRCLYWGDVIKLSEV